MHSVYTHDASERAIDAHFRSVARRFVFFDVLFVLILATANLLSLYFLVASLPALALYTVRGAILFSFLWSHRNRPVHAVRMYTTVSSCGTHIRSAANLSQHPPLQVWYLATLVFALAVHIWAFVVLFVLVTLGAVGFVLYAGFVVIFFLSYLYCVRSHTRFYAKAVLDSVETELRTHKCEARYAKSRSTELCERMQHDIDVYFHSKTVVSQIPRVTAHSRPERRRSTSLDRGANRGTGRRKDDRDSRQKRKKRHNQ